ncbi:hypothetical protein GOP47_0007876 [Adiantum capillus-veneris]|uniref:Uncharacterized protein n=1 Tax=Adiantum capillus-veneris TaxID=13818 RepID=A0A9D4ZLD1_ADICA|nr:hypothetical protein GOP47_0007876 [Adiantum capillus-veneris]
MLKEGAVEKEGRESASGVEEGQCMGGRWAAFEDEELADSRQRGCHQQRGQGCRGRAGSRHGLYGNSLRPCMCAGDRESRAGSIVEGRRCSRAARESLKRRCS